MKNISTAYKLNIVSFVLILLSSIWMFSGLHFGTAPGALEANRLMMFKYYTVDSNVIMGFIALYAAIMQKKVLDGKSTILPVHFYIVKLIGVVGVTLTMLVTIFFLVPTMGFVTCFNNSNLFLHLVNPIISIVTFLCFESTDTLAFKHSFTGISTMLIYAVYYVTVAVIHSHANVVDEGYDWYGFLVMGVTSGFIIIPLIVLITYLISLCLWFVNRKLYK